jgi:hypothetical protein
MAANDSNIAAPAADAQFTNDHVLVMLASKVRLDQ